MQHRGSRSLLHPGKVNIRKEKLVRIDLPFYNKLPTRFIFEIIRQTLTGKQLQNLFNWGRNGNNVEQLIYVLN